MKVKFKMPTIFNTPRNELNIHMIGKTHWTSHYREDDLRDNVDLMLSLGINDIVEVAGPRALVRIKCALTDEWSTHNLLDKYKNDMNSRYRSKNIKQSRLLT